MNDDTLTIKINKPIGIVYNFSITPPNSALWIPSIIQEETDHWPIRVGTTYKLEDDKGNVIRMVVSGFSENNFVEWISDNGNYHCRYSFKSMAKNLTKMEYHEWVDSGDIESPFDLNMLNTLKKTIEDQKAGSTGT